MTARRVALVLTVALVVYFALLVQRAIALLGSGTVVGVGLGVGVLILPVIGVWFVVAEWRFGSRTERLARQLADEGGLPDTSTLPRLPSGRIERAAADAWFTERETEVTANPDDWRTWFRLSHAYDIAGDRRRARQAMHRAVELEQSGRPG